MITIGILGVGNLAEMIMRGFAGTGYRFVLSPRRAETARRLAGLYGCEIAQSNQDVVDRSQGIFVSLPANAGLQVLSGLRFSRGQTVLSAMAGTRALDLAAAIGPASGAVAMMPGYANALRMGPSVLFPGPSFWEAFLEQIGPVHVVETEALFLRAAVFGAVSGASFAWMATIIRWFEMQGLPSQLARSLVAETLRGNAEVLLRESSDLEAISACVSSPGGITELLLNKLSDRQSLQAWEPALDAVAQKLRGAYSVG